MPTTKTQDLTTVTGLVLIPGAFAIDDHGLVVHGQPDFATWASAMRQAHRTVRGLQFVVGDLMNYGMGRLRGNGESDD
jgi:hypothetical protein